MFWGLLNAEHQWHVQYNALIYKSKNPYLQTRRIVSLQTNNKQSSHCVLPNMGPPLWHFETNNNNSWNEIRTCCIEVLPWNEKSSNLNTWSTFLKLWEQMKTHVVSSSLKNNELRQIDTWWTFLKRSETNDNELFHEVPRKWTSSKFFIIMKQHSSKCGKKWTLDDSKIPPNVVKMWQLTLFCSLSPLLEEEEAEPMNKQGDEIA